MSYLSKEDTWAECAACRNIVEVENAVYCNACQKIYNYREVSRVWYTAPALLIVIFGITLYLIISNTK